LKRDLQLGGSIGYPRWLPSSYELASISLLL